jgi:glycosyltransferase involved in cell wall biosynthesis
MLPQGPSDAAGLWVDVGNLLNHRGHFTGIQRTLGHMLEAWFQMTDLRLRLCRYDVARWAYREVPRQPVEALLQQNRAGLAGGQRPAARPGRLAALAGRAVRSAFRALPAPLRGACRNYYGSTRQLARTALGPLRRLGPAEAPFLPGDALLVAGNSWAGPGVCEMLAGIRRTSTLHLVPLIYDVIPAKLPHLVAPALRRAFEAWLRKVLELSDLVLTISNHSRRDLVELARREGLPVPPVAVLRLGDELRQHGGAARPRDLPDGVTGPFVLCVGSLDVRKNHALLVEVWRRLVQQFGDRVPPLLLAGGQGWSADGVLRQLRADPLIRGHVLRLPDVTDPELRWLYENCLFTLFPSHYEGWGLPVAESLAHGKFCICSSSSSLPEIAGDLVAGHDPTDLLGCLRLVRRALFEPAYLAGREGRIRREFRVTPWRACAEQVVSALESNLGLPLRTAARRKPGVGPP